MGRNHHDEIRRLVRDEQPFGPMDAAKVHEPASQAALYDWNNRAFAEMLHGSDIFVGRRGSGKTQLLSTFLAKQHIVMRNNKFEDEDAQQFLIHHKVGKKSLTLQPPNYVVGVDTPTCIETFRKSFGTEGELIPIERGVRLWTNHVWYMIGSEILKHGGRGARQLSREVVEYLDGRAPAITDERFRSMLEALLEDLDLKVVVTIDNAEEYRASAVDTHILHALIGATSEFVSRPHGRVQLKLCLPAEYFHRIQSTAPAPDKDLYSVQYLNWNAAELLHIATRRLRLYFELYDAAMHDLVAQRKIASRAELWSFWRLFFPEKIRNSEGVEEETFTYILRHTQLLPRHFIAALNSICKQFRKSGEKNFSREFTSQEIVKGVAESEEQSRNGSLVLFRAVHPDIHKLIELVLPQLGRAFTYGELHRAWRPHAKVLSARNGIDDEFGFCRLLVQAGVVGVVEEEFNSDHYILGRFQFNTKHEISMSEKSQLCMHPMYSRTLAKRGEKGMKFVLPRGSDFQKDRADRAGFYD